MRNADEKGMSIGYLPLIVKGGGVFGDVFDWESTGGIIDQTLQLFAEMGYRTAYINHPVTEPRDYQASEKLFREKGIDVLFVHALNIAGGEGLYRIIQHMDVPVIIASVPEPDELFEPPYTNRYASFCGGQWNMNMMHLLDRKARFLFGLPQEKPFRDDLDRTMRALEVIKRISDWKVCLIGDKTPGYYGAICSEDKLLRSFGSAICYLDFGMVKKLGEQVSDTRVQSFISENYPASSISPNLKAAHIENSVRVFLTLQDFAQQEGIDSYTMKCVAETIHVLGAAPCGINSLLTEHGLVSGCEGDILGTLSMYIATQFSRKYALMVDIMSVRDPKDKDNMLVWHCGAGAPSLAGSKPVKFLESPILTDGNQSAQGICVDFIPDFSSLTMSQLTEDWKTGGYRYFAAAGKASETKPYIGGNSLNIQFSESAETVGRRIIEHALPHHFQISDGNIVGYIEELCFWKDIDTIVQ